MKRALRSAAIVLAGLVGLFLVARAVAEPFVIDLGDPASYQDDWGGPCLAGVLVVHCGPGLLVIIIAVALMVRRRRPSDP